MSDGLKESQRKLFLESINLRVSHVFVKEHLDLESLDQSTTLTQSFRSVDSVNELEPSTNEEGSDQWIYKFIYNIGNRLIQESEQEASQEEDFQPLFEVIAFFEAKYVSTEKVEAAELEKFSEHNVGFNVWPYWREYVQSSCMRVGLCPPLEVPYYCSQQVVQILGNGQALKIEISELKSTWTKMCRGLLMLLYCLFQCFYSIGHFIKLTDSHWGSMPMFNVLQWRC